MHIIINKFNKSYNNKKFSLRMVMKMKLLNFLFIFIFIKNINADIKKECKIELGKTFGSGLEHKHTICYKEGIYCSDLISSCILNEEYNKCLNRFISYFTFKTSDYFKLTNDILNKNINENKDIINIIKQNVNNNNKNIKDPKYQKYIENLGKDMNKLNNFSRLVTSNEYYSFINNQAKIFCENTKKSNNCILGNYQTYKPFNNKDEKGNLIKFLQTDGIYDHTYDDTINILNKNNFECKDKITEAVSCKEDCMKNGFIDKYGYHEGDTLSCCLVCDNSNNCDNSFGSIGTH